MSRIRIGVVGCGLIGQMMHLPHLKELHELYEVVALCDVSPGTLKYVGDYYGIARRHTSARIFQSAALMLAAWMSTSTSPAAGTGSGRSPYSRTSGPP